MSSTEHCLSNPLTSLKSNYEKLQLWPKKAKFNIRDVLRAGFTYEGDGQHDMLQCVACGVLLGDWQPGDEPVKAHKDFYPECKYIQQVEDKKKPQNNPPEHESMSTFPARILTFDNWPSALRVDVCQLADAGFFYSGVGDKVICFYCDGNLKKWEDDDDPWMEHAHWFPACYYVRLVQGDAFVNRALRDRKSPRITDSEDSEKSIEEILSENCEYCNVNKKEIIFSPCGHVICCEQCSHYQTKCNCGAVIFDSTKLYNC